MGTHLLEKAEVKISYDIERERASNGDLPTRNGRG